MKLAIFKKYFPAFLFGYHLLFAFVGWDYVTKNNGDAIRYWFVGQDLSQKTWLSFFQPGTDIIKILTFPLVKYLHLPFWSGFLIFSIMSYLGFYKLWQIILALTRNHQPSFLVGVLLLLLPNLHLWTSFIGKESILLVALVFMVEKIMSQNFESSTFIMSFLVIALIRPHVAIVLLFALLIATMWKGNLTWKKKLQVGVGSAFGFAGLYFILKKITFIPNKPWERIIYIYQYHIRGLKKTAAYVPLDDYGLPYKLFTFYFRPLPFEKTGWLYQIWSLENLILLLLSGSALYVVVKNFKKIKWGVSDIFTIFAILLLAIMYVYAYANYGLIARTKIMAMPFLYIVLVKILAQSREITLSQDAQSET